MLSVGAISELPLSSDQDGAAAQNLTASLFTNNNTFYTHTVTATYSLVASRYDNQNTFYTPTVTATYSLIAARFDNTNTLYGPSVTSSITLTANRYDNTNVFYDVTVTAGAINLLPSLYENQNTFYAAVVTQEGGPQFILPDLYANTNVFYAPTVDVGVVTLLPDRFNNQNVFYLPTVTGGEVAPVAEGGGSGSGKRRRKRKVYIERDGRVYVFANEYDAQAWSQANKPQKKKKRAKVVELKSNPVDVIDIEKVKQLAEEYGKTTELMPMIDMRQFDDMFYLYQNMLNLRIQSQKRMADEEDEDILILLLAA